MSHFLYILPKLLLILYFSSFPFVFFVWNDIFKSVSLKDLETCLVYFPTYVKNAHFRYVIYIDLRLQWSRGSVLAFDTQVRGFKPGRSRRIFQDEEILSTPSFGREVKPFVPCRIFTARKRSLNVTWKSGIFRQNSSGISRPSSSSFHY